MIVVVLVLVALAIWHVGLPVAGVAATSGLDSVRRSRDARRSADADAAFVAWAAEARHLVTSWRKFGQRKPAEYPEIRRLARAGWEFGWTLDECVEFMTEGATKEVFFALQDRVLARRGGAL